MNGNLIDEFVKVFNKNSSQSENKICEKKEYKNKKTIINEVDVILQKYNTKLKDNDLISNDKEKGNENFEKNEIESQSDIFFFENNINIFKNCFQDKTNDNIDNFDVLKKSIEKITHKNLNEDKQLLDSNNFDNLKYKEKFETFDKKEDKDNIFSYNPVENQNNFVHKMYRRNKTAIGNFMINKNDINEYLKEIKGKENVEKKIEQKDILISLNSKNSDDTDKNQISSKNSGKNFCSLDKNLINKSPIEKNLIRRRLNLSYIDNLSSNIDIPSKNIKKNKIISKKESDKNSIFTNDPNNRYLRKYLKISNRKQSKKLDQVFPSSTKNLSKKEISTSNFSVNTPFESKQDLMNDYPLINCSNLKVNQIESQNTKFNMIKEKNILETTVEFNSNNFNFISLESSINFDLLEKMSIENNKIEKINKLNIENNNNNFTYFKKDDIIPNSIQLNEFNNSKCSIENSIDRFSLFNIKKFSILIFGGKSKISDFNTYKYEIDINKWKKIDDLKITRSDFGIINLDNKNIVILGGKIYSLTQKENITDSTEIININSLTKKKYDFKLKQPKCNFGTILLENDISKTTQDKIKILFIGGGYNGMEVLNQFEFYDFSLKKWVELPNMPFRRKTTPIKTVKTTNA